MAQPGSSGEILLPDKELGLRPFVTYTPEEIVDERTDKVAGQMCEDYGDREILMVSIAVGGAFWAVPLARAMRRHNPGIRLLHTTVRFSSYGQERTSSGTIREISPMSDPVGGRHVLIVDEVVDTGNTTAYLTRRLQYGDVQDSGPPIKPASIAVACLVDKAEVHNGRVVVNYAGIQSPNIWLAGCGMDHEGLGRELPAIYRSATPDDPSDPPPFTIPPTISPFGMRAA